MTTTAVSIKDKTIFTDGEIPAETTPVVANAKKISCLTYPTFIGLGFLFLSGFGITMCVFHSWNSPGFIILSIVLPILSFLCLMIFQHKSCEGRFWIGSLVHAKNCKDNDGEFYRLFECQSALQ